MKIASDYTDLYVTKDIYLASSLIASGFPLKDITKNEKQFSFLFLLSKDLEHATYEYWEGVLQTSAKDLFTAFKDLKNRMYNQDYE